MFSRRVVPVLAAMGAAGAAWAAVLITGLLAGARLLPLGVAAAVAVVLVVPGFAVAVITARSRSRGRGPRQAEFWQVLRQAPRWALIAAGVLFAAFWLAAMTSFTGLHGDASIQDGRYVLDNHGTLTVISKAAYDRELDHEERLALGALGGFGTVGALLCTGIAARARSALEPLAAGAP